MTTIPLPEPNRDGRMSVEAALWGRRSVRDYRPDPLTLAAVSQLHWAAQGISASGGRRTAPSAGATYPLETYLVAGAVTGLVAGVYHYAPAGHGLTLTIEGDRRSALAAAALGQDFLVDAPVSVVLAAAGARTARRYGTRADPYVQLEAGHAAQNVALQAVALGLGTVMVGAFDAGPLAQVLRLPADQTAEYCVAVGRPR